MRLSLVIVAVGIAVAASSVGSGLGRAATRSTWYWSPGLCKTNLQRYGVRIDDGRTFHIAQAFCVCTVNKYEQLYPTYDDFQRASGSGAITDKVKTDVANQCARQIVGG